MSEIERVILQKLEEAKQNLILAPIQGWEQQRLLEYTAYWEGRRDGLMELMQIKDGGNTTSETA